LFVNGNNNHEFFFDASIHARVTLFAQYIGKLVYPYPLSVFYPFERSSDFFNVDFLASLFVVVLFGATLFLFIKKKYNFFAFSFIWFAVLLSPMLLLLVGNPAEQMLFGRFLFAPGIGFSFVLATLFTYGLSRSGAGRLVAGGLLVLIIVGSWAIIFPHNNPHPGINHVC